MQTISFIKDLLLKLQLDTDVFSFSLEKMPFSENNESSWYTGTVAKLFFNFMEVLINTGKISDKEIENLKTKEYTKKIFPSTHYPALSNSRNNHGDLSIKRYRIKPLIFKGSNLFVSTQFYKSERDTVIEWYKSHLS